MELKKLGQLVNWVDNRNKGLQSTNLLGISIDKFFMPSVANIIGTDLSSYKVISENQFACNPMHVGRDEKMPVSLYMQKECSIVSPAYFVFEVADVNEILPEYLMLWFRRNEFDREVWFHTDGSVRGGILWEELCELIIPVPSLAEQQEIVDAYNDIERRIALKRKINDNLESQAITIFKHSYEQCDESELVCGTISNLGVFVRGKNLTSAEMREGTIPVISAGIEPSGFHNVYNVNSPSITISGSGVNAGYVSYHAENIWASDCSYNNSAKYIRCLYLLLRINQSNIFDMQKGTAQPHVYPKEINPFEIKFPNSTALEKVESQLKPIFDDITSNLVEIKALQETLKVYLTAISSR